LPHIAYHVATARWLSIGAHRFTNHMNLTSMVDITLSGADMQWLVWIRPAAVLMIAHAAFVKIALAGDPGQQLAALDSADDGHRLV